MIQYVGSLPPATSTDQRHRAQRHAQVNLGAVARRTPDLCRSPVSLHPPDDGFTHSEAILGHVTRIESVFPKATLRLPAEKPGNVVLFAFRDPPGDPRWDELESRAGELEAKYTLEFGRFVRGLRKMNRNDGERLYLSTPA